MCKAFSGIIKDNGEVLWQLGMDSHEDIIEKWKLVDDGRKKDWARFEIAPRNGDYLNPDEWVFRVDEQSRPAWLNEGYEKICWKAKGAWQKKLDAMLVHKPIVHPFRDIVPPKKVTKEHLALLKDWASVWDSVGTSVGASVWDSVGASVWDSVRASVRASVGDSVWASVRASVGDSVGTSVGASVGDSVGASVWDSVRASVRASVGDSVWASVRASVGDSVGTSVGASVGASVRASVRASVGASVGDIVWAYIGSFFLLPRDKWLYTENIKTDGYPFQPAVDPWMLGLVPSFDGKVWRLHGGKSAKVLWVGTFKEVHR